MHQTNFGYIIRKKAQYHPEKTAIVDQETREEYTYADLERRSNSIATELQERGIGHGDRVCGLFRNSIEFFDLLFATSKVGAVTAPLNHRLSAGELDLLLDDCDPDLLVYESVFEETVADLDTAVPTAVVGTASSSGNSDSFATFYEHDAEVVPVAGDFEDTAIMVYTSGSTGRPKGVPLSHKNLFFSSVNWIVDTELNRSDVTVVSSPIYHVGGINEFTLSLLHTGGTLILQKEFEPAETWDVVVEYGVTKIFAVTTMLKTMIGVDGWRERDLSALELVVTGGEPVPSEVREAFMSVDIPCVAAYGLTETTDGSLIVRPEDAGGREPECAGQTFTHVEAKVVDEDGNDLPPGETGEIVHRGPTVADGYFGLPDKTDEAWIDGWFYTGDMGMWDEDGFIHVLGRIDNMIISGGENIFPGEVEEPLHSHPDIDEVVVLGVPHEKWGEAVKAVVVPTSGTDIDRDSIAEFLDGKLARFKHPKVVEMVDELPKGGTGKIQRKQIQDEYTPNEPISAGE